MPACAPLLRAEEQSCPFGHPVGEAGEELEVLITVAELVRRMVEGREVEAEDTEEVDVVVVVSVNWFGERASKVSSPGAEQSMLPLDDAQHAHKPEVLLYTISCVESSATKSKVIPLLPLCTYLFRHTAMFRADRVREGRIGAASNIVPTGISLRMREMTDGIRATDISRRAAQLDSRSGVAAGDGIRAADCYRSVIYAIATGTRGRGMS